MVSLIRELRLFCAANFFLFCALAGVLVLRTLDAGRLLLPCGFFAAILVVGSVMYLVAQDWFLSFLTANYFGFIYIAVVCCLGAAVLDVGFNKARVTSIVAKCIWWWPT